MKIFLVKVLRPEGAEKLGGKAWLFNSQLTSLVYCSVCAVSGIFCSEAVGSFLI